MRRLASAALLGLLALSLSVLTGPAVAHRPPTWQGSRTVKPTAYRWLNDIRPADTYSIAVLRGVTVGQALHRLGGVRHDLGKLTYRQAESYALDHGRPDYSVPPVVQVTRLGHAVVVYQPDGYRAFFRTRRMTPHALMAAFITDVDLDTDVEVARHGRIVRRFDPFFRPPRHGALPEERGLHFGAEHGNLFARSWALIERMTLTHVSRAWFGAAHPTYVLGHRH